MVVGGRYRLLCRIGAGAMGEVWRAEHVTLGTQAAVKLIDAAARGQGEDTLARFLQEARAAAQLRSPNVVQILDHGADGSIAYIAMELLDGESLGDRLERLGSLPPAEVARILTDMARAVGRAHELGIVHRDLKPENVFMANEHGRELAKILDFGIAKIATASPSALIETSAGMMVGTPAYMSPEQVLGNKTIDWRSDLWQMAIIAFECVCGRRPFEAHALGELFMKICSGPMPVPSSVARVPPGFDEWFARAARRVASERFASAGELVTSLCAVLTPGLGEEMSVRLPVAPPSETSSPGIPPSPEITMPAAIAQPIGFARHEVPASFEAPPIVAAPASELPRGVRRLATIGALAAFPLSLAALVFAFATRAPAESSSVSPSVAPAASLPSLASASAAPSAAPQVSAAPSNDAGAPLVGPKAVDSAAPQAPIRPSSKRPEDVLGI